MLFNSAGLSFAETRFIEIGSILNEPEKEWIRFKEGTKDISFLATGWSSGYNADGTTDGWVKATCALNSEYRFNVTISNLLTLSQL